MEIKFIKLSGRPRKDRHINVTIHEMEECRWNGFTHIPGYIAVLNK